MKKALILLITALALFAPAAVAQVDPAPTEPGQTIDDAIGFGFGQFLALFDWGYIFSLIFLVALLYKFILGNIQLFNKIDKIYPVIVIGVILGYIWMMVGETSLPKMIVSFPFAVLVHKALLTRIMQFLKLED